MPKNIETELKLRLVHPETREGILASALIEAMAAGAWRRESLEAQYFDTADYALKAAGLTYRIRREGGDWVATVKTGGVSGGGLHQRQEWSVVVPDNTPAVAPFAEQEVGPVLATVLGDRPLESLIATRFERDTRMVHTPDGSKIELALDNGWLTGGKAQEAVQEVELELKEGNPAAVLRLGADLAGEFPLLVETRSKYYRAIILAGLAPDANTEEAPPAITGDTAADAALTAILVDCITKVLAAQENFLTSPADSETLHQVRLKLRRLRSVLAFAKPLLPAEESGEKQAALRNWGQSLGPVRDVDMLINQWNELVNSQKVSFGGKPWLGDLLTERRQQMLQPVREMIAGGQATPLFLDLWAWVAGSPWHENARQISLSQFIADRLAGWLKNLVKAGEEVDWPDEAAVHNLRIKMKKIRYVLKSLPFLTNGRTEKLAVRLKEMQDVLGHRRDTQIIMNLVDDIIKTRSSRAVYRDAGIIKGWQARGDVERQQTQAKKWKRLRRIGRRWLKNRE